MACDSLESLGGRQSALKVPGEVKSILEPQGRERWMVVQGIWLVPTWETVFCEQAWEGVGKGTVDRGPCSEQVRSPTVRLRLEAPVSLNGMYLRGGAIGAPVLGGPPPWGP